MAFIKKKKYLTIIIIFSILLNNISILGNLDFYSLDDNQTKISDSKDLISETDKINKNSDNEYQPNSINEYLEFEKELLNSLYDESWDYDEWREFVVLFGYETGQLNDEIINMDWVQYNIHLATIVKWGQHNGSLTQEEINYFSNQMKFETVNTYITVHEAKDNNIRLSGKFTIGGPELVVAISFGIRSEIANPSDYSDLWYTEGKWWGPWEYPEYWWNKYYELVYEYSPILPWADNWLTPEAEEFNIGPYDFESAVIENNVNFRFRTWIYFLLFFYYDAVETINIIDDDNEYPEVNAYLVNSIDNEVYKLTNEKTYDISPIEISDYDYWSLLLFAEDPSGVQWKGVFGDNSNWWEFPSSSYEISFTEMFSNYPSDVPGIKFGAVFRDKDNDRPNDYSDIFEFRINLDRRKLWECPLYGGTARLKLQAMDKREGYKILVKTGEILEDATIILSFKHNKEKNRLKILLELVNNNDYPMRMKLRLFSDAIHNTQLVINEDILYMFNGKGNDYYTKNGEVIEDEDIEEIFENSECKIEENGIYDYWIQVPENSINELELFEISVKSMEFFDPSKEIWFDAFDGISGFFDLMLNWKVSHKENPTTGIWSFFSKLNKITNAGDDLVHYYYLIQKILTKGENVHGRIPLHLKIEEAFIAQDAPVWAPSYKWWWNLTEDSDSINSNTHLSRHVKYSDALHLNEILIVDTSEDSIWKEGTYFGPGSYLAVIVFIPDKSQLDALQLYLLMEIFSDICYWSAPHAEEIEDKFFLFAIGIILDVFKYASIVPIINGRDPPDNNYREKPNAVKVDFPYHLFPELSEESPLVLKGKKLINNILDLEQNLANFYISTNRYNTAYNIEEYQYCKKQCEYSQEFISNISDISTKLNNDFKDIINQVESSTGNSLLEITEEEILDLQSSNFTFDPRFYQFVEDYNAVREVNDLESKIIIEGLLQTERRITSIDFIDKDTMNKIAPESLYIFNQLYEMTNKLCEENVQTYEYISIEKLGIDPLSGEEVDRKIVNLELKLNNTIDIIDLGDYYNGTLLTYEIMRDSMNLYNESLRKEFLNIYHVAENLYHFCEQMNQFHINKVDHRAKDIINGMSTNFTFTIKNRVSDAFKESYNNTFPLLQIPALPNGCSYRIFYNETELEKTIDGYYYIHLGRNEIKSLKVEINIKQNSALENCLISLTLIAFQNTLEKQMYYEIDFFINILDDDTTPPDIIINEENFGWIISIMDNDGAIDSIATGTYQVLDEEGNIIYSEFLQENITYQIILPFKIGTYFLSIFATNNDKDCEGDEETSNTIAIFVITLDSLYEYINRQLEELKTYIDENLSQILSRKLNHKIILAQEHLNKSHDLFKNGNITCSLFHDSLSRIFLRITECKTKIFIKIGIISEEDAEYILTQLHNIRNNIVFLMGYSVNKEQGYNIATINVDLLNLNDFVEQELSWCHSRRLINHIKISSILLEGALFLLSMDISIECNLDFAQWKLERAKFDVFNLLNRGKITQELAEIILHRIEKAQIDIETVKNNLIL